MAEPDADSWLRADEWWRRRRPVYNVGLFFSLVLGYVAYGVVLELFRHIIGTPYVDENGTIVMYRLESGGLESLAVCAGGLIYFLGGNICFYLGPLIEAAMDRDRAVKFRRWAWPAGLILSCSLPFSISGLHLFFCLFLPGFYDHTPVQMP